MVTIVIPTYNRATLLCRAIQSVITQTFSAWELIVVDDGSTDGTGRLVAEFRDSRITYLRTSNRGVSHARNCGIKESGFPYIAFLDSDDTWHPQKLSRQVEILERDSEFRVVHTEEIWIRNGRRVNPKKKHRKRGGWIYLYSLPLCVMSPSSILLHRSVLDEVGLFDEAFPVCEDYELWLRIASRNPVQFLMDPLTTKFGGHPDQLSRSRWGLDEFRVSALRKILRSGQLTYQQEGWTKAELTRKCAVLARGFANRRKVDQALHYRNLSDKYRIQLETQVLPGIAPVSD